MQRSKMGVATACALAAFGMFAGACGSSSKSGSGTTTTTDATAASTDLTVTAGDYAYEGVPATIKAGIVNMTFVNKGGTAHEMAFLKVADGTKTATVFADLPKIFQGQPFPPYLLALNGVHDTPAGKTTETSFNLTPGHYLALCSDTGVAGSTKDGQPHFSRGMYKAVTVTGTGGETTPTADTTLTAHDYGFDVSGLKTGTHTVAFKNTGPVQWHFAEIQVFPKGTTVQQATTAVGKLLASQGPPPPGVPQPAEVAGSQAASPGMGNTFSATFETGRTYVVFCFISDKKGGPPHAIAHQMYKVFTVS